MTEYDELMTRMEHDLAMANERLIDFRNRLDRSLKNKNPLLKDYAEDSLMTLAPYASVTAENAEDIQRIIKDTGNKRDAQIKTLLTNFTDTEHEREFHDAIGSVALLLSSLRFFLRLQKKLIKL